MNIFYLRLPKPDSRQRPKLGWRTTLSLPGRNCSQISARSVWGLETGTFCQINRRTAWRISSHGPRQSDKHRAAWRRALPQTSVYV